MYAVVSKVQYQSAGLGESGELICSTQRSLDVSRADSGSQCNGNFSVALRRWREPSSVRNFRAVLWQYLWVNRAVEEA